MIEQAQLERANRHIEEALARLVRLDDLQQRSGLDAGLVASLMHNMRISLRIMIRHRLSLRRDLAQAGALATVPSACPPAVGVAQPGARASRQRPERPWRLPERPVPVS